MPANNSAPLHAGQDYDDELDILAEATIPEHSLPLMRSMSGGMPLRIGEYLFFAGDDWLSAIAYPLRGRYSEQAFRAALAEAIGRATPVSCFAIGSSLPAELASHIQTSDRFYVLSAHAEVPAKLRNVVNRAAENLSVRESDVFSAGHRRLWAEFMAANSKNMAGRVAALYARAPQAVAKSGGNLRLLDAIDKNGNIAACLLLDYAPQNFCAYVIGAHSRLNYAPHATDLLFAAMIKNARSAGKRYIHLGLGVNDGILRFKLKWGARPSFPYLFAAWQEKAQRTDDDANVNLGQALAAAFLRSGATDPRQELMNAPVCKPFAMLWEVRKKDKISWVGGTAHFFCHSFEPSFRRLFRQVDNVIFEGPLDAAFMERVDRDGKSRTEKEPNLLDILNEGEITRLDLTVNGGKSLFARSSTERSRVDVRWLLAHAKPWCAFFTLWTAFLERRGWHESVDMEAWRIAQDMGKNVLGMENLEEQLESLGSLPVERVARFFRNCGHWPAHARRNLHAYLAGDLEGMMGSSAEFPTRTEHVIGRRDQRFRERMRPFLEAGRSAVFVGSAHMVNLRHMLAADGFSVRQAPFGIWPKIHYGWRKIFRPDEKVTWQEK